jgi:hypothetical protein
LAKELAALRRISLLDVGKYFFNTLPTLGCEFGFRREVVNGR